MIHDLKTWKEYFDDIVTGHKNFEVRKDDRGFKEGDTLILKEFDHFKKQYTARQIARTVTYVLHGDRFGIEAGYVVMAIQ